jgi:sulfhydrogenase subunit beta (sulfur reductase)
MIEHDDVPLPDPTLIPAAVLDDLIALLLEDGRMVIAPVVRDGAVIYDQIHSPQQLARGWTVQTGPGRYRSTQDSDAVFDNVIGPTPWKRFLHPPQQTLGTMTLSQDGAVVVQAAQPPSERYAFIGVRACDLAAIEVLDRVMMGGAHPDPRYSLRRRNTFIVAVNCRVSADTCFCAAMETGPRATTGFDLCLSELKQGFVIEAGSVDGASLMAVLPTDCADDDALNVAQAGCDRAAAQQTRCVVTNGLPSRLRAAHDHARWDDVAARCLNCTNCTMVCPTCFCTSIEEVSDLAGTDFSRQQRWDSCFTSDFSFVHGGSVRPSARSRYRQWLTHKLGTWPDQFEGDLGCTGCGRCIAWCPVGIDLTEEIAHLTEEATP